jgi:hypothetical protein
VARGNSLKTATLRHGRSLIRTHEEFGVLRDQDPEQMTQVMRCISSQ